MEKNHFKLVEELLKNYKKAKFNKEVFGAYHLERLIAAETFPEGEEETVMESLELALNSLKRYPEKGEIYYAILQGFFVGEQKKGFKELMQKLHVSSSTIYIYKSEAIAVLAELFKSFYAREEVPC